MEMDVGVLLEPVLVLLMGVEVVEDDVQLAALEGGDEPVHEAEELDPAAPFRMRRDDPAGGDLESCKQGRGAMPLVVMALSGQGASVWQLQIALCSLQGLDRRLLVDTQNNRLGGRIDIEADHVGGFRRKRGVVALAPGLAGGEIDPMLAQEAPNILNVNVAKGSGQQRPRPAGIPFRRRLIQKRKNALVRDHAVDRLLARSRTILQPLKAVVGKAVSPLADNARLNPHLCGNLARSAPLSRKQHDPRTLLVTLRRYRCPAARLKHLAHLRPEPNFSCFGNHPDLES